MSPVPPTNRRAAAQPQSAEPKSWTERAARYHGTEHPSNTRPPADSPATPPRA